MTPSLPTRSMALAISSPISDSPFAEMVPTCTLLGGQSENPRTCQLQSPVSGEAGLLLVLDCAVYICCLQWMAGVNSHVRI